MHNSPTPLAELHAIREHMLAEAGGTLEGLVAYLHAKREASHANPTERTSASSQAAVPLTRDPESASRNEDTEVF